MLPDYLCKQKETVASLVDGQILFPAVAKMVINVCRKVVVLRHFVTRFSSSRKKTSVSVTLLEFKLSLPLNNLIKTSQQFTKLLNAFFAI